MKIFIYLFIIIAIYFYICNNNIYIISRNQHIYFWLTIIFILFICYLIEYQAFHLYKFLQNMNDVQQTLL